MPGSVKNDNPSLRRLRILGCVIVAGLAGVLYVNSLGNQFTNWDDAMVYNNSQVRSLGSENLVRIFTFERGSTYQPVRVLSYAIDHYFWGLNPVGYHVTNILFYMLTCVMVFLSFQLLSRHLRGNLEETSHWRTALFGSLLFAAHPVHVEAVTWLAARKEVLQGFFFFSALYFYLKAREGEGKKRVKALGLTLIAFLLAILSKPSAIVFPAVVLVYEIAQGRSRWMDTIKKYWVFLLLSIILSAVFTFILISVMVKAGGIKPFRGGTFFSNTLISFSIFLDNIKLLVVPINYSAVYNPPILHSIWGARTFFSIVLTCLMAWASLWSLRKTKVFFFSFFFFVVTILPYLNLLPINKHLADRYVFIASYSFCFLLGVGWDAFYRLRHPRATKEFFKVLSVAVLAFVVLIYGWVTFDRNTVWQNSYTLWSDAVEKAPEDNTANALMGAAYMEIGMNEEAAKYLEKAVALLPYDYFSRNNLGIVYGRLNQPEKGLKEFLIAMQLKPEDDVIKINLAVLYQKTKNYSKAEEIFKYLLSKSPRDASLHYRLGLVYKEMKAWDKAVQELKKSMELAPAVINPYEEMGNLYLNQLKNTAKAKEYFTKGIESAPKARLKIEELRWIIQDLER